MVSKRAPLLRSALLVGLVAAVAVPVSSADDPVSAQSWQGFSVSALPSAVMNGTSSGWALGVTTDLGGPGVDLWNSNHGFLSEAIIDLGPNASIQTAAQSGSSTSTDSHTVAFSDIDGDGDEDLFEVAGRNNNNRLFRNDGGQLVSVDPGGLEDFFGRGRTPLFADFDGDGDMDVLITNLDLRSDPVPQNERQLIPSEVYLNNGNGTSWTKAVDPNQVLDDSHIRLAQLTTTGPGTPSIVVTHDVFNLAKDSIAVGDGSTLRGASNPAVMRSNLSTPIREVIVGDFDNDLYPEFVVFAGNASQSSGAWPITAFEVSAAGNGSSVSFPRSADLDNCRSGAAADFDNDGDLDIIAGCSQLQEGQDRNVILLNDGNGNFTDAGTGVLPRTSADTASAIVTVDINRDGWMDAVVANGWDFERAEDDILANRGGTGAHWLSIDLVGSNPDAIGAQVFVGTNEWQVRENGHAYHRAQDARTLHFGLGSRDQIAPIEIQWPDGTFETCSVAGVDRQVTITQGGANCVSQIRAGLIAAVNARPQTSSAPIVACAGSAVTVDIAAGQVPTSGPDVILGTTGDDVIQGLGGNDIICGLSGDDVIGGGSGRDEILAGGGDDVVNGGRGADLIYGGNGVDVLSGDIGSDRIFGGLGRDRLVGGDGEDTLHGGFGADVLVGGAKNDRLFGNNGTDTLQGNRGASDQLDGGDGQDSHDGGPGVNDGCSLTNSPGVNETRRNCERGL